MNHVISALFGTGAADIEDACRSGDPRLAEYVLRTGHAAADGPGPQVLPVPPDRGDRVWAAVNRMTRVANVPADLEHVATLISTLHRMNVEFCLRLRHDGESGLQALLGLPSTELIDWARRLLAPDIMLEVVDVPDAPTHSTRVALQFRAASRPAEPPRDLATEAIGLFDLAAAAATTSVDVVINARPADRVDVERGLLLVGELHASIARHLTTTTTLDESTQAQTTDTAVARVTDWLDTLLQRLSAMRDTGAWLTTLTVSAAQPVTAWQVACAAGSAGPTPTTGTSGTWIADVFATGPNAASTTPATSLLGSQEIASWLRPPRATRAGLEVGPPLPADRRSIPTRREVWLGNWAGTSEPARLDLDDLAGHVFIAGVTGSGKTTTVLRLLLTAWNRHQVPFLVIDPVKGDYEVLAGLVTDGLTVVRGRDLRLNVLEPAAGFDHATHLDHIAAAFKGAFSMPSPVPYVTSLLFDRIRERADLEQVSTLHDLHRLVTPVVRELGYRGELQANILASLGVRLSVLCAPERARRLCTPASITHLFTRPTVVSLADIGDDEERAFIMSALTIYASEHARMRGSVEGVAHLTVLEEAHRMVAEPGPAGSSEEHGDAAGHASRLITALLAEIRSYGESLVVLDQSPSAVARDVVRNTNTKIVHRLLDPADRDVLGGAIGLDADATAFMSQLQPGEAVVSSRRLGRPQLIKGGPPLRATTAVAARGPVAVPAMPCCGTDEVAHQRALLVADAAGTIVTRALSAALVREPAQAPGVARTVTTALGALAARQRHPVRVECLREIGVRVALEGWQAEGWLPAGDLAELRSSLDKRLAPDGEGVPRAVLPVVPAPAVRPFRGCRRCLHACSVRPVGRSDPRLLDVRHDVRRVAHSQTASAVAAWQRRLTDDLLDILGPAAAADAARCVVLHALDGDVETDEAGAGGRS